MNKAKKKQPHRFREQTSDYQWGEGRGKGNIGVRGEKFLWDYAKLCVWNFWKS